MKIYVDPLWQPGVVCWIFLTDTALAIYQDGSVQAYTNDDAEVFEKDIAKLGGHYWQRVYGDPHE